MVPVKLRLRLSRSPIRTASTPFRTASALLPDASLSSPMISDSRRAVASKWRGVPVLVPAEATRRGPAERGSPAKSARSKMTHLGSPRSRSSRFHRASS